MLLVTNYLITFPYVPPAPIINSKFNNSSRVDTSMDMHDDDDEAESPLRSDMEEDYIDRADVSDEEEIPDFEGVF